MKIYTFKLVIKEGYDEFWESLEGKSGTDEVTEAIKDCLEVQGWIDDKDTLKLEKFEDKQDVE
jgi:hypothetical protein